MQNRRVRTHDVFLRRLPASATAWSLRVATLILAGFIGALPLLMAEETPPAFAFDDPSATAANVAADFCARGWCSHVRWLGLLHEGDRLILLFDASLESILEDAEAFDRLQRYFLIAFPDARRLDCAFIDGGGRIVSSVAWFEARRPPLREDALGFPQPAYAKPKLGVQTEAGLPLPGALSGKTVVVSPGHGWFDSNGGWHLQRGWCCGMVEDYSNAEIAAWYFIPYLEHAGARVYSVREMDFQEREVIVNNDDGSPSYQETGAWTLSSSSGYKGGTYRYATRTAAGSPTATATFAPVIPAAGRYAVSVFYRASANRVDSAHYAIYHSDGMTAVYLNQQENDLRWVYLGTFHFAPGKNHRLVVLNDSAGTGVVIADAARFGGGVGDVDPSTVGPSGKPRWQESCRPYARFHGAPSSVYSLSDVNCRPEFADWQGGDAYISLHSNASADGTCDNGCTGAGRGTETFMYNGTIVPGSQELRDNLHAEVVRSIKGLWASAWNDRGLKTANFGELRETNAMPSALIETAFHDNDTDNGFLQNADWRHDVGRAMYKGVLRFFKGSNAVVTPLPLLSLAAVVAADGSVTVSWAARPDPLETSAVAADYLVEASSEIEGVGVEAWRRTSTSTSVTYPAGTFSAGTVYYVRVKARNSGGVSLQSEPVAFAVLPGARRVLVVNGFDRHDRSVTERDNTHHYVQQHARALLAAGYGCSSATNEAVAGGLVALSSFDAADWFLGEESTVNETFSSTERAAVQAYLEGGGRLLVNGAEIGWDLVAKGTAAEQAWFTTWLKAVYKKDDALTYGLTGRGVLGGVVFTLASDRSETYNVDYPDVIEPLGGSGAEELLRYDTGDTAGVAYIGAYRLVFLGFPFETVLTEAKRTTLMAAIMDTVLFKDDPIPDGDQDAFDLDVDSDPDPEPDPDLTLDPDPVIDAVSDVSDDTPTDTSIETTLDEPGDQHTDDSTDAMADDDRKTDDESVVENEMSDSSAEEPTADGDSHADAPSEDSPEAPDLPEQTELDADTATDAPADSSSDYGHADYVEADFVWPGDIEPSPCAGVDPADLVCKDGYRLIDCECVRVRSKKSGCAGGEGSSSFAALLTLACLAARRRRGDARI